jgi:WD40 repeat protein
MLLVSGSDDGTARLFDMRSARQLNQYSPPDPATLSSSSSLSTSSASPSSAPSSNTNPLSSSSSESSSSPSFFFGPSASQSAGHVSSVSLSSTGRVVFVGSDDGVCRAYDLINGSLLQVSQCLHLKSIVCMKSLIDCISI